MLNLKHFPSSGLPPNITILGTEIVEDPFGHWKHARRCLKVSCGGKILYFTLSQDGKAWELFGDEYSARQIPEPVVFG